jgi:hypothetical protein
VHCCVHGVSPAHHRKCKCFSAQMTQHRCQTRLNVYLIVGALHSALGCQNQGKLALQLASFRQYPLRVQLMAAADVSNV